MDFSNVGLYMTSFGSGPFTFVSLLAREGWDAVLEFFQFKKEVWRQHVWSTAAQLLQVYCFMFFRCLLVLKIVDINPDILRSVTSHLQS
jgi:hypothetical protein